MAPGGGHAGFRNPGCLENDCLLGFPDPFRLHGMQTASENPASSLLPTTGSDLWGPVALLAGVSGSVPGRPGSADWVLERWVVARGLSTRTRDRCRLLWGGGGDTGLWFSTESRWP